jgi:hypothetical protein
MRICHRQAGSVTQGRGLAHLTFTALGNVGYQVDLPQSQGTRYLGWTWDTDWKAKLAFPSFPLLQGHTVEACFHMLLREGISWEPTWDHVTGTRYFN